MKNPNRTVTALLAAGSLSLILIGCDNASDPSALDPRDPKNQAPSGTNVEDIMRQFGPNSTPFKGGVPSKEDMEKMKAKLPPDFPKDIKFKDPEKAKEKE